MSTEMTRTDLLQWSQSSSSGLQYHTSIQPNSDTFYGINMAKKKKLKGFEQPKAVSLKTNTVSTLKTITDNSIHHFSIVSNRVFFPNDLFAGVNKNGQSELSFRGGQSPCGSRMPVGGATGPTEAKALCTFRHWRLC